MRRIHWSWLTAGALMLAAIPALADDWQEWRGPNRDAVSTETNWLSNWPPAVVWSNNVGRGCGTVSVYDGRLYAVGQSAAGDEDVVYCFNAKTGDLFWTNTYSLSVSNLYGHLATPTVSGNEVYTFSHDNQLRVWNRFTGAPEWEYTFLTGRPGDGAAASPLVIGDRVIVNAGAWGTAIRRIPPYDILWGDVDNGTNSGWASPIPLTIDATPYVAVVNGGGVLHCTPVDGGTNGKPTISADMHTMGVGDVHADPIVWGNRLYVCGVGGSAMFDIMGEPIYELFPLWSSNYQAMVSQYMNCVIADDYIYGCSFHLFWTGEWEWLGTISCARASNGAIQWRRLLRDEGLTMINSRPVLATVAVDKKIVMLHEDGKLNIMSASTNSFNVEGRNWISPFSLVDSEGEYTAPVVADGLLYCRSMNGELICYQIGPTNTLPDNDGDSIPDTWEQKHFLSRNSCDPATDSDGDGHSNEDEFIVGTEPTNITSALRAGIVLSNGEVLVSCQTRKAEGTEYYGKDRCYTLESRTSLLNGAWQQVTDFVDIVGDNKTIVHTNGTPVQLKFYRVKAKLKAP